VLGRASAAGTGVGLLIVVPPFAALERPSLAAHLLQACAGEAGFAVKVLYANLWLASEIGLADYQCINNPPLSALLGERYFARSAHDLPAFGGPVDDSLRPAPSARIEECLPGWCERVAGAIAASGFPVVGCTTSFEQTNASLALLRRVKRLRPSTLTLLGGANCEGPMAEGLAAVDGAMDAVDYIFDGESEEALVSFLDLIARRGRPAQRIVRGARVRQMDALPSPVFDEYFAQRARFLPEANAWQPAFLSWESSRGCWWGEKQHCTFCGLNGELMQFREKSPRRLLGELRTLAARYPMAGVAMTDNIMPHTYFRTLLPLLAAERLPLRIFYEEKANLTLERLQALKRAGVISIQPGIEALSTDLLQRMKKGVTARQNLTLLRDARAAGVHLGWNLLCDLPGDRPQNYLDTFELLPTIHHLQPPQSISQLSIDRFSPYYREPEAHGLRTLRPLPSYAFAFPPGAPLERIAYRFEANYESAFTERPDLADALVSAIAEWRQRWAQGSSTAPTLRLTRADPRTGAAFLLRDTRGLPGTSELQTLSDEQGRAAMTPRRLDQSPDTEWALERRLGVAADGWYVPVVTARPELLRGLERACAFA
jgi:ribosomal peptide maturation radical SAM protein 1